MSDRPYYKRTKYGKQIFKIFRETDEPLDINDLIDKLPKVKNRNTGELQKVNRKIVLEVTRIMAKEGTLKPVHPKKTAKTFILSKKFRRREFDQLMYFDEMKKDPMFSDVGFFQHTLYGISLEDIPEMEQQLLFGVLHQIDNAMSGLYNINSAPEKLALQVLVAQFGHVLNQLFENEPSNKKCFQLLDSLVTLANKQGKNMKFDICTDDDSPYPEKLFLEHFTSYYREYKKQYLSIKSKIQNDFEPVDIALLSTKIVDKTLTEVKHHHLTKKEQHKINLERYHKELDNFYNKISDELVKKLSKFKLNRSIEDSLYKKYRGDNNKIIDQLIHECVKPSNSYLWYQIIEKMILENYDVPFTLRYKEEKIIHINSDLLSYIIAKDYFDNKREIEKENEKNEVLEEMKNLRKTHLKSF